jgi:Cellulase (glycosyl hydrolase family 5)
MRRANSFLALSATLALVGVACGSDSGGTAAAGGNAGASAGSGTAAGGSASGQAGASNGGSSAGSSSAGNAAGGSGTGGSNPGGSSAGGATGGRPAGWLYTDSAKLKVSDGKGSGTVWVGRGVNTDDVFFCGYDNTLWMPDPGAELQKVVEGLISGWKPNFIRLSLSMDSYGTAVNWTTDVAKYQKPMIDVVKAIGKHDGVYVLLALRSDASMIGQDMQHGDPEATGIPSDSTTTPDKAKFPTGTDAVYSALVDVFKDDKFVAFGLTNEPGGNLLTNEKIRGSLDHAVGTIRKEEDTLGVPHHIVSVQGQGWTSDISFYADKPLAYDNVVYEVHGYPPEPKSYTYANIPVIIGEYGTLDAGTAPAFFADVEAKQLSSLAWDFDSYSNCAPDLLEVNQSSATLTATAWGQLVQAYLLDHAK